MYPKKEINPILLSDVVGVGSSFLCFIHCHLSVVFYVFRLTPDFEKAISNPYLDYIFLFISFCAVWHSASNTEASIFSYFFWIGFSILAISIIFEADYAWLSYGAIVGSIVLSGTHIGNIFYCKICINKKN